MEWDDPCLVFIFMFECPPSQFSFFHTNPWLLNYHCGGWSRRTNGMLLTNFHGLGFSSWMLFAETVLPMIVSIHQLYWLENGRGVLSWEILTYWPLKWVSTTTEVREQDLKSCSSSTAFFSQILFAVKPKENRYIDSGVRSNYEYECFQRLESTELLSSSLTFADPD